MEKWDVFFSLKKKNKKKQKNKKTKKQKNKKTKKQKNKKTIKNKHLTGNPLKTRPNSRSCKKIPPFRVQNTINPSLHPH
jgi:hypothetical protein